MVRIGTDPSHKAILQVCIWGLCVVSPTSTQLFSSSYFVCFNNRITTSKLEECSHKHLTSVSITSLSITELGVKILKEFVISE